MKDWQTMSAEERRQVRAADLERAVEAVQSGQLPTGIRVTVAGREVILRPQRVTGTGGVSYGIAPRQIEAGGKTIRINKISLTLLGTGSVEPSFEEDDIM